MTVVKLGEHFEIQKKKETFFSRWSAEVFLSCLLIYESSVLIIWTKCHQHDVVIKPCRYIHSFAKICCIIYVEIMYFKFKRSYFIKTICQEKILVKFLFIIKINSKDLCYVYKFWRVEELQTVYCWWRWKL